MGRYTRDFANCRPIKVVSRSKNFILGGLVAEWLGRQTSFDPRSSSPRWRTKPGKKKVQREGVCRVNKCVSD